MLPTCDLLKYEIKLKQTNRNRHAEVAMDQ